MITKRKFLLGGSISLSYALYSKKLNAKRANPSSAPDPGHIFYEYPGAVNQSTYSSIVGKTARSTTINPVEKTLVLICAGQSLFTDLITDTFNPVNGSKLDNFCWYDGTNWAATTPILGTSWNGSIATSVNANHKIADGIISNAKFDRVILISCNVSGTTVDFWANEGALPNEATGYYRCILAAAKKLASIGITPSTPGVKFLIKWNQGESDTSLGTSQVNYVNYFNKMKSQVDAILPVKWMVAKETWYTGIVSSAIQAAQLSLVDNVSIFAGENMDSIDATGRVGDNTHLNATGGNLATSMGISAITAITF